MVHDARHFLELAAHLVDDAAGRTSHGLHGHGAEQERYQSTQQQADQHHVVIQREVQCSITVFSQGMGIVREQYQRSQTG